MANVRCQLGHEYDNSKYTNCPQCPVKGLRKDAATLSSNSDTRAGASPSLGASSATESSRASAPQRQQGWAQAAHPTTKISWKSKPTATASPSTQTQPGPPSERPPVGQDP